MHLSETDYKSMYRQQKRFLVWLKSRGAPFYLTGGTALSRFYLNHRYSEDLDLFANALPDFRNKITELIKEMPAGWLPESDQLLITDDFARFFIIDSDIRLKIEFVNDVPYRPNEPILTEFGLIDTPFNILSNKLTALMGRVEPKDVFDIIHISLNYAFEWNGPFKAACQKAYLNELDVAGRLAVFPVSWFHEVPWLKADHDIHDYSEIIQKIVDDFLFNRINRFGEGKPALNQAVIQPGGFFN